MKDVEQLVDSIKRHEGFMDKPYPDPIHGWAVPTFGHGLTYITASESEHIVRNRITSIEAQITRRYPSFQDLSVTRQHALVEMAFQMGVGGLFQFRRMWAAIERGDFEDAHKEALDSRWAVQTPNRARAVAARLRDG
jgi:lysozyme